jgi:hypothetical protein
MTTTARNAELAKLRHSTQVLTTMATNILTERMHTRCARDAELARAQIAKEAMLSLVSTLIAEKWNARRTARAH